MRKITPEDTIDNLLMSVPLAVAESLLERAQIVMKLRRKQAEIDKKQEESA